MVGAPVAQAVPAVANRKGQGLPRALPPATVARLLASCDRRTRLGRRDYAMLMLLARLGLRAGEVASLSLDDIGWRSGELTVHGKGGRDDRLPLPADVGAALAAWLRIRPKAQTRAVFLRANAPIGAISPRGVAWAVYQRLRPVRGPQGRRAPAPPQPGNPDAGSRGVARRGRPGPAARQGGDDRDLREGRPSCAGCTRPALAGGRGMSGRALAAALAEYLAVRRCLGFKLARDGLLLDQFVGFCERAGASRVTSELALAWVSAPATASPGWLAMRLTVVRGFARWLQASDPATEVPPLGWLPPRRRTAPYLYSADDVAALLAAARRVRWPLSAASYETLIALLAVTGMRVGEAIRLDRSDLSPGEGLLTIWDSKFGTSRQLLLHPSAVRALGCYLRRRAELSPAPGEPALLVHPAGNRLNYPAVQQMFRVLLGRAGIRPRSDRCRPTIHGLRHSFAVNTLIRWYREGADVQARLPQLSTWLGHTDPKWTYWYLSASPELLALAAERLEAPLGRRP